MRIDIKRDYKQMRFVCQGGMNSQKSYSSGPFRANGLNNLNNVRVRWWLASQGPPIKMGSPSDDPINC